jgi:hypothetical protein
MGRERANYQKTRHQTVITCTKFEQDLFRSNNMEITSVVRLCVLKSIEEIKSIIEHATPESTVCLKRYLNSLDTVENKNINTIYQKAVSIVLGLNKE